jgi:hypothetical protein
MVSLVMLVGDENKRKTESIFQLLVFVVEV